MQSTLRLAPKVTSKQTVRAEGLVIYMKLPS